MDLATGDVIDGKYRVVRHIGAGGMGTVYEGENVRIGRRVAIKVLHAQVASLPEFVQRFEREARAAARVGSPHVCDVLDLGDLPGGDRFIVMEYLEGVNLEDRLAEKGRIGAAELAPIAFELLEGLGTMHAAGVIHRDLKPANVFLARHPTGRGEVVKILDFGVAKLQPLVGEVGSMTQTGAMMGTPLYMSPEQARGARDVDGRTDLYAASVIFYRALTGVLPYTAETLNELLFKIVLEDPKPIRELAPEVDEAFAALVHRGLCRDVDKRFETARAYQEAIATWGRAQGRSSLAFAVTLPSEPPPARRPSAVEVEPTATRSATAESAAAESASASATPSPNSDPAVSGTLASGPPQSGPARSDTPKSEGPGSVVASSRPSDGTPTAWSEDAPPVAANAAALDVTAPSPGSTQAGTPSVASAQTPAIPAREPTVPSPRRTITLVATAAAALGFIALFLGARGAGPSAAAPAGTAAESRPAETPTAPPPVEPPPVEPPKATETPPPVTEALPETTAVPPPTTSPEPRKAAPLTPVSTAPTAPRTPSKGEPAKPAAKAAPTTTASTKPPNATPAPSSSTAGRKFRTNLD